jgi:hypothetical protein
MKNAKIKRPNFEIFLNMDNNASEAAWSICRGIGMGTTTVP